VLPFIPHSEFHIPHSKTFRIPHSAFAIPHSPFRIPQSAIRNCKGGFMYDAFGILFLISIGSLFLILPLATGALVLWIWEKAKLAIEGHSHLSSRKTLRQFHS
jgi:hypothetical protein